MPTTPPTFSSSAVLTAADLNLLRDAILELQLRADGTDYLAVQVNRNANQSISDSSSTEISWDTQQFDLGAWWSAGTDIEVPAAAIPSGSTSVACRVFGKVFFAADATGTRRLQFLLNGAVFAQITQTAAASGSTTVVNFDVAPACEAGDIITAEVEQTSGGNLNITATITVERAGVSA